MSLSYRDTHTYTHTHIIPNNTSYIYIHICREKEYDIFPISCRRYVFFLSFIHLFHPLFIFILLHPSSSCHSLYTHHTHTSTSLPTQLEQCFISLFPSLSLSTTTKKSNWQKRKKKKKKTRREYTTNSNTYTHSLSPTSPYSNSLSHSQQVGIETSQLSSAQLNFVIKIVKNLLRLYISLFSLGFESNRGENSSEGTSFFYLGAS